MSQPDDSDMLGHRRRPIEEYTYRQVTQSIAHADQPIVHVTYVQPGEDTVKASLRITPNQLILSKGHAWIPAAHVRVGHVLAIGYFGNVLVTKGRAPQRNGARL